MKRLFVSLMRIKKIIKKIFFMTVQEKLLLVEALILMVLARLAILLLPSHKLTSLMGKNTGESILQVSEAAQTVNKKVKWAVTLVSLHVPWERKCLVDALTAQTMLSRRRIDSTLYLGVTRDKNSKLIAHAWLRSGEDIISGGFESRWFTEVARFSRIVGGSN